MAPNKEKRRSKYDTTDVQPAKRAKPSAKREPESDYSQPEHEAEHSEPASETIEPVQEAIKEAPIHTMSSDEFDAEDLATKSGRYTDEKVAFALGEVRQMADEFKQEADKIDQEISDEAMVSALTQAEAQHTEAASDSRAGSVNGDRVMDPNETLLRLDPKLNLVNPRWVEPDGKFNIYAKVNKYGDRKYLNINSGKTLKQALTKFGVLPANSYGVKILPPFSVITADPLPYGQHKNRFAPCHKDYKAPKVPSKIPVPALHDSNFVAQLRFEHLQSETGTNDALTEWAEKQEKTFLDIVMPMVVKLIGELDPAWNDQIETDLESRGESISKANKLKYLIDNTQSFVKTSEKGLKYIPLKFRLFAKAKGEEQQSIEAGQRGQGRPYESIWKDKEMTNVVRDSVTRIRVKQNGDVMEPMTLTEVPLHAYRMLKQEERKEKSAPFVKRLTPLETIELMGKEKQFIGTSMCQIGLEEVKDKQTKKLSFKCVLQPLTLVFHQFLDEARQAAQSSIEQLEDDAAEDIDFGV